jgi:hypothetical protein
MTTNQREITVERTSSFECSFNNSQWAIAISLGVHIDRVPHFISPLSLVFVALLVTSVSLPEVIHGEQRSALEGFLSRSWHHASLDLLMFIDGRFNFCFTCCNGEVSNYNPGEIVPSRSTCVNFLPVLI